MPLHPPNVWNHGSVRTYETVRSNPLAQSFDDVIFPCYTDVDHRRCSLRFPWIPLKLFYP